MILADSGNRHHQYTRIHFDLAGLALALRSGNRRWKSNFRRKISLFHDSLLRSEAGCHTRAGRDDGITCRFRRLI